MIEIVWVCYPYSNQEESMKRILALMLVLVMLFGLCACKKEPAKEEPQNGGSGAAEPAPGPEPDPQPATQTEPEPDPLPEPVENPVMKDYPERSMVEVSQIKDPGRSITVTNGAMFKKTDDGYKLLTISGEDKLNVIVKTNETAYLGNDMYCVSEDNNRKDHFGLADADGNLLLPCNNAAIDWIGDGTRFLRVASITGETTVPEQALLRYSYSFGWYIGYYTDGLYAGTCRVYDTVAKQFVPNVSVTTNAEAESLYGVGDSFMVTSNGTTRIYGADGQILLETTCEVTASKYGIYCEKNDEKGGWVFYDDQLQQLSVSASKAHIVSDRYVAVTRDGKYALHNVDGTAANSKTYDDIVFEQNGVVTVVEDGKYGLTLVGGLARVLCEYDDLDYVGYGLYCGKKSGEDGNAYYSVITEKGEVLADGLPAAFDGTDWPLEVGDKWFVYGDGDFTLEGAGDGIGSFYAKVEGEKYGIYGLYDLFSGKELLERKYENLKVVGGYICGMRDNIWYIYDISEE